MVSLDEILKATQERVQRDKSSLPFSELRKKLKDIPPIRSFKKAILDSKDIALIGEIKKASPSAGLIRQDFSPLTIAQCYAENGARALSVLTEEKFFQGNLNYILEIKNKVNLPVLRKDFIVDEYQLWQSRLYGADVVLLIVSILKGDQIREFLKVAQELGMEVLVEIHNEAEWEIISTLPVELIGINNRNLKTLKTDLKTTFRLAPLIPGERIIISESGIKERRDILSLEKTGVKAVLVGEAVMKSEDMAGKIRSLLGR